MILQRIFTSDKLYDKAYQLYQNSFPYLERRDDNGHSLIMQNPEENEHDEIFYDELEAIYLTKHAIYVYIEKRSVIIIPKRNLKVTPFEAYSFLYKYIPKGKLILCR